MGKFPGLTGLFIAAILSASLSTVSSGINSIVTVLIEDIYKNVWKEHLLSDENQATASKILCKLKSLSILYLYFFGFSSGSYWISNRILSFYCIIFWQ